MGRTRRDPRRILAITMTFLSGIVVAACITFLTTDYVDAVRRAPENKSKLEALELAVREDASQALVLTEEYERQRDATLRRRDRSDVFTWMLFASAVLFLGGAKWSFSLKGVSSPTVKQIEDHRGDLSSGRKRDGLRETSPASGNGSAAEVDLTFVDEVVSREGRTKEAAIPILQRLQDHYRYLPDEALKRVCELTEISPAQITGVSSFYAQFRRSPVGRYVVKVCHGTACHVAGATEITEEVRRRLQIAADSDTDPQRLFTIDRVACIGCCSLAPVLTIEDETVGRLSPGTASDAIELFRRDRES